MVGREGCVEGEGWRRVGNGVAWSLGRNLRLDMPREGRIVFNIAQV